MVKSPISLNLWGPKYLPEPEGKYSEHQGRRLRETFHSRRQPKLYTVVARGGLDELGRPGWELRDVKARSAREALKKVSVMFPGKEVDISDVRRITRHRSFGALE